MDRTRSGPGGPAPRAFTHPDPARPTRQGEPLIALDTSGLTKLIISEPESPALVLALRGEILLASELVRTELRRAVARAAPELMSAVDALLAQLRLVRLDAQLLDAAGRLAPPRSRSLDAIHLQSALLLGDELDAFITYDARQADAARAAGLTVRSPS